MLVTLVEAQGSTPRAAGTKMLVGASQAWHSIGGGHLELRALEIARGLLASGAREPLLERFSLGASLGQCCGGAVLLLFEPLLPARVPVAVFGAGHVGRALVPLLAGLPCRVRWIDARAAEFPAQIPAGVETVVSDRKPAMRTARPATAIGRVPTRSDSAPDRGAKTPTARGTVAMSRPIWRGS